MIIGCIGEAVFYVNSKKIKTINSMDWSSSGRWSEHNMVGERPVMEFTGTELDSISLNILLSEYLGSEPVSEYTLLRSYARNGEAVNFVLGDMYFGSWYISSLKCTAKRFDGKGSIATLEVSVSMKEYN